MWLKVTNAVKYLTKVGKFEKQFRIILQINLLIYKI